MIIGVLLVVLVLGIVYAQAGFVQESQLLRIMKLHIPNMGCPGCGWSIEGALEPLSGITNVEMVFWEEVGGEIIRKGTVIYDRYLISDQQVVDEIEKLGYTVEVQSDQESKEYNE